MNTIFFLNFLYELKFSKIFYTNANFRYKTQILENYLYEFKFSKIFYKNPNFRKIFYTNRNFRKILYIKLNFKIQILQKCFLRN